MGVFSSKKEEQPVYEPQATYVTEPEIVPEEPQPEVKEEKVMPEQTVELAVISVSTKIEGNITTDGNLILAGDVKGNVNVKGNLVLDGKADGEIYCDSLLVENTETTSDIVAYNNIIVKEDTTITGNISCRNITVYGKICGDIDAKEGVVLKSTAVVMGNISSAKLGIETGARVEGKITCK